MIGYLITSMLLSGIGWLAYVLLVRRHAAPVHQKWFIYFVVGSSLLLPTLGQNSFFTPPEAPAIEVALSPQGHHSQLQHFCKCEQPNLTHRIHYRSNIVFNVLLEHKAWVSGAILLALALVFLRILGQYIYLYYLVRSSRTGTFQVRGETYNLLHPAQPLSAGAFRLGKPFIIWQTEMDRLDPTELDAVIQHELSHLRQRNTLEKALLSLIQCLWFLNPAFYFFRRELELISEWIADQAGCQAIGSRKAYAKLLIRLKEWQTVPVASHFKGQGSLQARIHRLLTQPKGQSPAPFLAFVLVLGLQLSSEPYLYAGVDQTLHSLETYEEIYLEHPQQEELVYCQDCHSVCTPQVEINECWIPEE